jgi:HTH-type transcriptional regulator / antitoxin HigA
LTENLTKYRFDPDYAVHPGRILSGILESRGISKKDFAVRSGLSAKHVSQILHGKAPITAQTSVQFERVLGISADTWDNLERNYQKRLVRLAERQRFSGQLEWLKEFPLKELASMGFLKEAAPTAETMEQLLGFLGVGSIQAYETRYHGFAVNFRRSESYASNPKAVAVWLRLCELTAEREVAAPYDRNRFVTALKSIRALTVRTPQSFMPIMKGLSQKSGVVLVTIGELPGTRLSGATRWLSKNKALIMLSLRYKTDDHFWFSFFHEAAHILFHQKTRLYLDELTTTPATDQQEIEANKFAQDILIPRRAYKAFVGKGRFNAGDISSFAGQVEVAPGIVVGRLQHDGCILPSWHNSLKRRFQLK